MNSDDVYNFALGAWGVLGAYRGYQSVTRLTEHKHGPFIFTKLGFTFLYSFLYMYPTLLTPFIIMSEIYLFETGEYFLNARNFRL